MRSSSRNGAARRGFPAASVAAGAVAGLVGAWFKLGWEVPWPPRPQGRIPEPQVLVSLFTHVPTPAWIGLLVHFGFSIIAGVAYGVLAEYVPIVAIGMGVGFGIAVWIGAHEIVMPLMGLTPPAWALSLNEQASEFFGHAMWGWVLGVFFVVVRRGFVPRPAVAPIRANPPVPEGTVEIFRS